MKSEQDSMAQPVVDALPSAQPFEAEPPISGWISPVPVLAGMFVTACVFMMVALYCDKRQRKQYVLYDWNKNMSTSNLTVPWYHMHSSFGDFGHKTPSERSSLLTPPSYSTINNLYSSKNKADSNYQKIKKKFTYFVTIPEEEELKECRRFQSRNPFSVSHV